MNAPTTFFFDEPPCLEELEPNPIEADIRHRLQNSEYKKKVIDYIQSMHELVMRHFPPEIFHTNGVALGNVLTDVLFFRGNMFTTETVRTFLKAIIVEYDCKERLFKLALELIITHPYISASQILAQILLHED